MTRTEGLLDLFTQPRFRRLLLTRVVSQTADGVFQTSLAGAVLFNPQHHTGPGKVAVGLVILLLPYSLVGPFAGVLLDRWRRRQVLAFGAATKAVLVVATALSLVAGGPTGPAFVVTALAALAINRFYLAALSAALPNVVSARRLVLANALSPTTGTVVTIAGGGAGLVIRAIVGSGDHGNAVVAGCAAIGYLGAAVLALTLPRDLLGPRHPAPGNLRDDIAAVSRDFVAGARHVRQRPPVAHALGMIFGQRFLFGLWTIMTLLLYRNTFHSEGPLRAGLVGVGQAVTAGGIGLVLGAAVTPRITSAIGRHRWVTVATGCVAVTELAFGAPFTLPMLLLSSVPLGFATQATKVCVDTIVQTDVDDEFRGRVFSLYDTVYNLSFVGAALVAAVILPSSGKSLPTLVAMAAGYALLAVWYDAASRSTGRTGTADVSARQASPSSRHG